MSAQHDQDMDMDEVVVLAQHDNELEDGVENKDDTENDGDETKGKNNEKKSIYEYYIPYGVTSFQQLDEMRSAAEKARSVRKLTTQFQGIVDNIVEDSEIGNKGLAIRTITEEYTNRLSSMEDDSGGNSEKSIQKAMDQIESEFLITKSEKDGKYYWKAIYSNDRRDRDNPPETISAKSHKSFVEMVEKEILPLPELWHWHIPGSKWGQATKVWFDDNGRACAEGYILPGHEHAAKSLMGRTDIRVSHGMPKPLIKRDKRDNSTIIRHATVEISDLPSQAAANEYTGFVVMKGENMQLTDDQKKYLKELGYSESEFPTFESLTAKDLKAKDAGESDSEDGDTEDTNYATREEVIDAVSEITDGLTKAISDLTTNVVDLNARVNGMLEKDATKVADVAAKTPPASLKSLILQRVSESGNTRISADDSLAQSGPKETENKDKEGGMFFQEWLNG